MKIISIYSEEFTKPIFDKLDQGKQLVIFHQIYASGGMQEWFIINNSKSLNAILSKSKVSSALTVYEWIEIPILSLVNRNWLEQVKYILNRETKNKMLLIQNDITNGVGFTKLTWVGEEEDLDEFYNQHMGLNVIVGHIPDIQSEEIVRGYCPDKNGVLKSGIY